MKTQEEQMEFQKYDYHNLMINALKTIKEANMDYIKSIWEWGFVIGFINNGKDYEKGTNGSYKFCIRMGIDSICDRSEMIEYINQQILLNN